MSEPLVDEPVSLPISRSDRAFDGTIWDVRRETFEYNGSDVEREFVDHPGAVSVLVIDEQDRILLIKQYRHPIRSREWEIPAGLLDVNGESALAAAKRELAEEVDLEAEEWWVLSDYSATPGGSNEVTRIFLARSLKPTTAFAREHEEADLELRWVTLDEAVDTVLARKLQNPALVVAVLAASASKSRGWATLAPADTPWPEYARLHSNALRPE